MSISNNELKDIIKLENKKYRKLTNKYLIFSKHIVLEAIKNNNIELVLTDNEDIYLELKDKTTVYKISKNDISRFKSVKNTEIVAVCNIKENSIKSNKILALNKLSDPGNVGTILRTAKAFGINDIIIDNDSVDIYNPKTIAAMQGVHFSLNIYHTDLYEYCKNSELKIISTYLDEDSIKEDEIKKIKDDYILILGNESQGMDDSFKNLDHDNYKIDIKYESLNVAIAAGIIIYDMTRER